MKRILIIPLFILSIYSGYAQHNHGGHDHGGGNSHAPVAKPSPHGGKLNQTGKYKVEMVAELFLQKDKLTFYLFKNNLKPIINPTITGTLEIHYNDGTKSSSEITYKAANRFVGQLEKTIGFHCVLTMIINEQEINFDFHQKGI